VRDGDVDMHAATLARDIHSLEIKTRASARRVEQVIIADLAVTEQRAPERQHVLAGSAEQYVDVDLRPAAAFRLVAGQGRLGQLLGIGEMRAARFRPRRNAPHSAAFDVDLLSLIIDWLHGKEVGEIGEAYLAVVADETYRYEQLSEFIAQVLEHLLPWLLNTLVSWVNEGLDVDEQLCPELPAYIRFVWTPRSHSSWPGPASARGASCTPWPPKPSPRPNCPSGSG
jgi:hypothetical protein